MRGFTKEDLWLLLISFLIAVSLWFNIAAGRQETVAEKQFIGIPVKIQDDTGQYNIELKPKSANVLLQGSPKVLSKLNTEDVLVILDVSKFTPGELLIPPRVTIKELKVRVKEVNPDRIEVTVKAKIHQAMNGSQTENTTTSHSK